MNQNAINHGPAESNATPLPLAGSPNRTFRIGTLLYTTPALVNVFIWMLWGDLCLNLMESVIPRLVPLQLQHLGASDAVVGILTGSVFSLMNWIMNPVISTWSDRHRSRLGRRIPFMLYPTPLLAFFLIMVGFSDEISSFVQRAFPSVAALISHFFAAVLPDIHRLSPSAQLAIGMTGVMLVLYKFFDLFPQCVYYYLFADVIPQEVIGTFVCLFRLMATLGAVVFHYWLLQYADSHPKATYIACGSLYLLAFLLLSLLVKEGEYPPPPPRKKLFPALITWFRESFSIPFYWNYFVCYGCFRWAYIPFNLFLILFAQNKLHMNTEKFGHVMALVLVVQLPVLLLLGPVLDRFHPVRVGVAGFLLMAASSTAAFLMVRTTVTFLIFSIGVFVAIAVCQSALSTMSPRLLWRERYGQFCAAAAMVAETGLLVLSGICGVVLDRWGEQFVYLWVTIFSLLGCILTFALYKAWKHRGGDDNYSAPTLERLSASN